MANDLLTFDEILRDSLDILTSNCIAAKCVNRRYEKRAQGAKQGDSFYVPIPETPTVSDGAVLDLKDIDPEKVLVTLDKHKHTAFVMSSAEMTHSAYPEFSEFVIKPRMEALANQIDIDLLSLAASCSMSNPVDSLQTVNGALAAAQRLTEHGVPMDDRYLILSPKGKTTMLGTTSTGVVHLSNVDASNEAFRKGIVGNTAGFDVYESPNVYTHTVGSDVTSVTVNDGAIAEGDTVLTLAGATMVAGDVFTIASVYDVYPITKATLPNLKQFVVVSVSGNDYTISPPLYAATGPNKNINALPVTSAVVTAVGTASTAYGQSIAMHRDAFGLVTADLILPNGVHGAARRSHKGISATIITDFDSVNYRFFTRIDVLYGVVAYRPHTHAVRIPT